MFAGITVRPPIVLDTGSHKLCLGSCEKGTLLQGDAPRKDASVENSDRRWVKNAQKNDSTESSFTVETMNR